jgi:hypothetical protein
MTLLLILKWNAIVPYRIHEKYSEFKGGRETGIGNF